MTKASSGGNTTAAVRILVRNTQGRARSGVHGAEAAFAALVGIQRGQEFALAEVGPQAFR